MASKAKSLYRQCSAAIDQLIAEPPRDHGGVFTEIDVEAAAATTKWTTKDYVQALKDANTVCGTKYRSRQLCRYGPVELADGTQDYARIAGKIVYADAETGPEYWETPNGKFAKLMVEDDELTHQGRRPGTNRTDHLPWADQQSLQSPRRPTRRRASSVKNAKGEAELRSLLENALERIEALEKRERERERLYARA